MNNQIVVDEFDKFSKAVENIDFSIEDIVAYVTSLTKIFYWLNVESIWGQLGFAWDYIDTERKGYGHFNASTIPFTVIPKIPDGERIIGFDNTFNSILSDEVKVNRSNWENFTMLKRVVGNKRRIEIDLIGANITTLENIFNGAGTLYLKADLSNAEGSFGGSGAGYYSPRVQKTYCLEIDDDNKYLNVKNAIFSGVCINYKGDDYLKLEYVFDENYLRNNSTNINNKITVLSDNHKYYLTLNDFVNANVGGNNSYNFNIVDLRNRIFPVDDSDACDIYLDCSYLTDKKIILFKQILAIYGDNGKELPNRFFKPLKIIGDYNSIDSFNPYVLVDENHGWTDDGYNYDSNKYSLKADETFYFMRYSFIHLLDKCPYNISFNDNCKNIYLFQNCNYKVNKDELNDNFNIRTIDIFRSPYTHYFHIVDWYPTININDLTKNVHLYNFGYIANDDYTIMNTHMTLFDQSIVCNTFDADGYFVFGENFHLTCYNANIFRYGGNRNSLFLDADNPHVTIKFDSTHNTTIDLSAQTGTGKYFYDCTEDTNVVDYFRIDTGTGDVIDRTVVENCIKGNTVCTLPFCNDHKYKHPIIITNKTNIYFQYINNISNDCQFIFIKSCSFEDIDNQDKYNTFMSKCLNNIVAGNNMTIKFKSQYYSQLSDEVKTHLTNINITIKEYE